MPRVKTGPYTRQRRNKWLKAAKGYWGGRSKLYRTARMAVIKAGVSAYKERKRKKRVYRALWILRLNAALKAYNISYSRFINALKKANIELDRRALSELAIQHPEAFEKVVETAKPHIPAKKAEP
jgi:large subunit ribosomal protein L20